MSELQAPETDSAGLSDPAQMVVDVAPPPTSLLFAPTTISTNVRETYLQTTPLPRQKKKAGRGRKVEVIANNLPYRVRPAPRVIKRDEDGKVIPLSAAELESLGEISTGRCDWAGCTDIVQTRVDYWHEDCAALKDHLKEKHFRKKEIRFVSRSGKPLDSGEKNQKKEKEKEKEKADEDTYYSGRCLYRNCNIPVKERYLAKHILISHMKCTMPRKG